MSKFAKRLVEQDIQFVACNIRNIITQVQIETEQSRNEARKDIVKCILDHIYKRRISNAKN